MNESIFGGANSITVRLEYKNTKGMLANILRVVSKSNGDMSAIDVVSINDKKITRDLTINATDSDHEESILSAIRGIKGVKVVNVSDQTFLMHLGGKIEVRSKIKIQNRDQMSRAYTPGVGKVSDRIARDNESVWTLTGKSHTVAIVTDGSAVLGLGDIGPEAALPVMEGKAVILKEFAGVDSWPICLNTQDVDAIVNVVKAISPGFGGIHLEDIGAPRCFEIERILQQDLDIPVFHDDQHGTAIVVLAALINSLKVLKKKKKDLKVVLLGLGAAGTACAKMLNSYGIKNIIGFNSKGIFKRRHDDNYEHSIWLEKNLNPEKLDGSIGDCLKGADFFLGLAGPNLITKDQIKRMNKDAIVFALSNPNPEILPQDVSSNVAIMATGRSDFPNQVNNSLAYPGFFRGLVDCKATTITNEMKIAAAKAIASVIPDENLSEEFIMPSMFDASVVRNVAKSVASVAVEQGLSRKRSKSGSGYLSFKRFH
ncbi:MAG: NAD-dependent malic enzyme [Chloroflexota bacterium]